MDKSKKDQKNNLEVSNSELSAFIYQQVSDLKHLLPEKASLGVVVKPTVIKNDHSKEFTISLIVIWNGMRVESSGTSKNIYDAASKAKKQIENKLGALQDNLSDLKQRAAIIDDLLLSRHIH